MNKTQALQAVRARWPDNGTIRQRDGMYELGYIVFQTMKVVSKGKSWDEACLKLPPLKQKVSVTKTAFLSL